MFNTKYIMPESLVSLKERVFHGFELDDSLFATSLMMLYSRVEKVSIVSTYNNKYDNTKIDEGINFDPNVYSFHWYAGYESNPDAELKKHLNKPFTKLPTHEKFLAEQLKQNIYIRIFPENNAVCIFCKDVDLKVWHSLQVFISKYFKIFEEKKLTNEEKDFLGTLSDTGSYKYTEAIKELTKTPAFRKYSLYYQLDSFEKRLYDVKIKNCKREIEEYENEMKAAMEDYKSFYKKMQDSMIYATGLETMAAKVEEHTELQNFLMKNERLCNVTIQDSYISFIAKTFLAPSHVDDYDKMTERQNIYTSYETNKFSAQDIKLLMDAVLSSKRTLKVKLCAYFTLDYFGSSVNSMRGYKFEEEDPSLKDYLPNPHLHYHNCFGQNEEVILDQLKCGDVIGSIECCFACAQRVYIHDISFTEFVKSIFEGKGKYFVAKDGTEMTTTQAIAFLKESQNVQV